TKPGKPGFFVALAFRGASRPAPSVDSGTPLYCRAFRDGILPVVLLVWGRSDAEAKDPQRNEEAVSPDRQGEGQAPPGGDEPPGLAEIEKAPPQPARHEGGEQHRSEADSPRPGGVQRLTERNATEGVPYKTTSARAINAWADAQGPCRANDGKTQSCVLVKGPPAPKQIGGD